MHGDSLLDVWVAVFLAEEVCEGGSVDAFGVSDQEVVVLMEGVVQTGEVVLGELLGCEVHVAAHEGYVRSSLGRVLSTRHSGDGAFGCFLFFMNGRWFKIHVDFYSQFKTKNIQATDCFLAW